MRVVDLGCGLATDIAYLLERGFTVVGVDQSEAALRQARALYPKLELVGGDVRALPFEPASFDYLLDPGCCTREANSCYAPACTRMASAMTSRRKPSRTFSPIGACS